MSLITLQHSDRAALLTLHNNGVFNPDTLALFNQTLDAVEADASSACLIITGEEKSFSQGLDLDYLLKQEPATFRSFVEQCMQMIGRLLCFPIPVCCAINGHAFGLGAMLVLAADYRVMRGDRGYICLPEIDLKMSFVPSMSALVLAKLPPALIRPMMLTGKRIGGVEAEQQQLVDKACGLEQLLEQCKALAEPMLDKDRSTLSSIKGFINADILAAIAASQSLIIE